MVWSTEKIKRVWQSNPELISPYSPGEIEENPAKLYLHLGEACYCSSNPKHILSLSPEHPEVTIRPNDIFLFQTLERVRLPYYAAGRMALRMDLITKGLITSNLPQIDPSYHNYLFGMAYNLSSQPVTLRYGAPIVVLELYTVAEPQRDKDFAGNMQSMTFPEFVETRVSSSLGTLEQNTNAALEQVQKNSKLLEDGERKNAELLEKGERRTSRLSIMVGVVAIIMAACGLFEFGFNCYQGLRSARKDDAAIAALQQQVDDLEQQVQTLLDQRAGQ